LEKLQAIYMPVEVVGKEQTNCKLRAIYTPVEIVGKEQTNCKLQAFECQLKL